MAKSMFSDKIVASDAFLDMPLSTQALYFHLGMNADNDGFVQPKKIMRMVGAANDDLEILIAKRFILVFGSGVAVIKHWWINNTKRADRYSPTTYQTELTNLQQKPNKAYSLITTQLELETDTVTEPKTTWQPHGNQLVPQTHIQTQYQSQIQYQVSSSKVGKPTTERPERVPTEIISEILAWWTSKVGLTLGNESGQRRAIAALVRQHSKDDHGEENIALGRDYVKRLISGVAISMDDQYAPRISDFVSLKRKQNDLIMWGRKRNSNRGVEVI